MTEPRQEGLDIRQWGRLIWRRKWLLLAIVIVIPTLVYVGTARLPKVYQSRATINVRATAAASSLFSNHISASSDIAEAQTLIKTTIVGRRAARLLGESPENAGAVLGHVTVVLTNPTESGGNFLTITAQSSDPVEAARIANAVARAVAQIRTSNAIRLVNRQIAALTLQSESGESTGEAANLELQQLRLLKASQGGTTPTIEPAVPAAVPISPNPRRNATIALILALLTAAALPPLLDRLDRRLREPGELEELLKAPVLALIPDDAFPGHIPGMHVRESFQTLRASLTYFNVDRELSSLVVASPIQQDGKTTVAVNMALAYALDERDVILIDGDLRRPQVAARLGKEVSVGLDAVLVGAKALDETLVDIDAGAGRLRILPGAIPPPNPAVLLGSKRMRSLLAELSERVDLVVIDTPGLLAVSDAIPLFNQVDGSVLVSRLGRTPKDAIQRASQVIESAGGTVLGSVATGAHAGGIYGYYGYYGNYGSYGGENGHDGTDSGNGSGRLRGLASGGFRRSSG
ncbi:MAG: polysaccharide biosynthesis tyrosine autokinase [Solirubrobacterales bacterium]